MSEGWDVSKWDGAKWDDNRAEPRLGLLGRILTEMEKY